ncbi:class I SAM-dependent methyltransferase [Streptomyces lavenduligriseus]|nr:class I SAM-dependent methyltransferase [Streptomyces lavenduligriseus]
MARDQAVESPPRYRIAPGAFLTWRGEDPVVAHVDRPFEQFEISADLAGLFTRLSRWHSIGEIVQALDLEGSQRADVAAALSLFHDAGILLRSDAFAEDHPPLREAAFEAQRTVHSCADLNRTDPAFVELYTRLSDATLTSPQLAYALRSALVHLAETDTRGDVVECGVWRGGSMALAAITLQELGDCGRDLWLFDTFGWFWENAGLQDGFVLAEPAEEAPLVAAGDTRRESSKSAGTSQDEVRALITDTGYPPSKVRLVPGMVQETIPENAPERIALLRLDTDLYESTMHELRHLYPRLVPGGVLIIDDYGKLSGATRAVDEYFSAMKRAPLLHRVDTQGRVGVKPT